MGRGRSGRPLRNTVWCVPDLAPLDGRLLPRAAAPLRIPNRDESSARAHGRSGLLVLEGSTGGCRPARGTSGVGRAVSVGRDGVRQARPRRSPCCRHEQCAIEWAQVLEVRMESVRAPLLGRGRAHETVRFTGNRYRVQSRSVDGGHHRRHDPAATRFPPRYRSTRTARVRSGVVLRGYQLRARADDGTGGGARRPLEGAECRWHAYGRQHQPGGAARPGGRLLRCRARWPDRLPGHR